MASRRLAFVSLAAVTALSAAACGEDGQPLASDQCRGYPDRPFDIREGYPDSLSQADLNRLHRAGCLTKPGSAQSPMPVNGGSRGGNSGGANGSSNASGAGNGDNGGAVDGGGADAGPLDAGQ